MTVIVWIYVRPVSRDEVIFFVGFAYTDEVRL